MEAITLAESKRLRELEQTISRNESAMQEIAAALTEIHDRKLYKSDYSSFREYCKERWGFGKSHAYRLIAFNEEVKVSPMGDIPKTEREARKRIADRKPICDTPSKTPPPVVDVDEPPRIKTASEEINQKVEEALNESLVELSPLAQEVLDALDVAIADASYEMDLIKSGLASAGGLAAVALKFQVTAKKINKLVKEIKANEHA